LGGENAQPPKVGSLDRSVGRSAFGGEADLYHRARPGYAAPVFEHIGARAVPMPRVLEIGAGTGLATQGLLQFQPRRLVLLEPDERLCRTLADRFSDAKAEVICGTFPETEVEGPFDLVACAAAFHWMDPVPALALVQTLVAPGGVWAMWWNCYFGHGNGEFSSRMADLMVEHDIALPPSYRGTRHYALDTDHHTARLAMAGFSGIEHFVLHETVQSDSAEVQALFQTFSFISTLPEVRRARVLERIAESVETEFGGQAPMVVATALYSATC
jgi:SAM-dependent methyltransferase